MNTIELEKVEKVNDEDTPHMRHILTLLPDGSFPTKFICGRTIPAGGPANLGPLGANECVVCGEMYFGVIQ